MIAKMILLCGVFGETLFFTILTVFGMSYLGITESSIYVYYWAGVCFFVALLTVKLVLSANYTKKASVLFGYIMISIIFLCIYGIGAVLFHLDPISIRYGRAFLAMACPSFIIGVICSDDMHREYLGTIMVKFIPIATLLLLYNMMRQLDVGYMESLGGMNRLGTGYYAAQLLAVTLCLLHMKREKRQMVKVGYLHSSFQRLILLLLLFVQILVVLFSASRGPVIAMTFLLLYFLVLLSGDNSWKKLTKVVSFGVIMFLIYRTLAVPSLPHFTNSVGRIATILRISSGDDISTGRIFMYRKGIDMFLRKPLFGNGPQAFAIKSGYDIYPHNIFVELLCDYGIVGTILWMLLFLYVFAKYVKNKETDWVVSLVFSIALVVAVELMFSGTFTYNAQFWFVVGFGMFLPKRRNEYRVPE